MARKAGTTTNTSQARIAHAIDLINQGVAGNALSKQLAKEFDIAERNAFEYIKKAREALGGEEKSTYLQETDYKKLLCEKMKREISLKELKIIEAQFNLDVMNQKYVLREEAEAQWNEILLIVKDKLLGIPNVCAINLENKGRAHILSYLTTYIDDVLNDLSKQENV